MDTPTKDISELLERQHGDIQRLLAALAEEQGALTGNVLPAIEASTAAKHTCLLDIENGFRAQAQLLANAGVAVDDVGMGNYLRQCDPQGRLGLEQRWRRIKELLGRCREQNLLNGRIVAVNQRQTQQALAILRGGSGAGDDCYGRTGQAGNGLASRSLGKV